MKTKIWLAIAVTVAVVAPVFAQQKAGSDATAPYDRVAGWLKPLDKGRIMHPVTVFAESENRVFIGLAGTSTAPQPGGHGLGWAMDRALPGAKVDHQVFVVDRNGKLVQEWSQWSDRFGQVQKITLNPYDTDKHVWIIDRASQQVMEFTNDGKKLVLSLGEKGVAGHDHAHFDQPADICWLPDGTFYVADGFANSRVVKFDKNGKYLMEWGVKGKGPAQFNAVASLAVDAKSHVYVTDRLNRRVQIFDSNGKYVGEWTGFKEPTKVLITQDQQAWVLDGAAGRLAKYSLAGKLLTSWGDTGASTLAWPLDFSVDPQGNLYVVNGQSFSVDKYVSKKNADKSRLVGQPYFLDIVTTTY